VQTQKELYSDKLLVKHSVTPSQNGVRLDRFLQSIYHNRSREKLKESIVRGSVLVKRPHFKAGKLKPSFQLLCGDEVQVLSTRRPEPDVCFDYRTLYEDDFILVIDKPANLPVHPAGKYYFNTLIVHLKTKGFTDPMEIKREFYLAHRIDRETSGVLVLAKNREVCANIVRQFAERETQKEYLAIVHGQLEVGKEFDVDLALGRSKTSRVRIKMAGIAENDGGMASLTHFKCLKNFRDYSLLSCKPKTGRQHQIRVHIESHGYPIVGDKLYGLPDDVAVKFYESGDSSAYHSFPARTLSPEMDAKLILPRHALHAYRLKFRHPMTGKVMEFESKLPDDLKLFMS